MATFFPLSNAISENLSYMLLVVLCLMTIALCVYSFCRIKWQKLAQYPFTLHIFCLWLITLILFAYGRTGVLPGLSLHLYALTAATLMMGKNIAYLCAVITQLFLWALGSEPLALIGWNCLLYAALPVYFSDAFCRLLQRLLPKNPFIFTLGAGFFGGIFTMIIIMCATSLLLAITGIYPLSLSTDKYLKFLPVIVYPEGFVNGVIITAVVAFMPNTLSAFDPDRYFINRP